jgi:glycosidase
VRPEFTFPPGEDTDIFRLNKYLIGLRRRHPWLHRAMTSAVELTNSQYVYETRNGDDALVVALNVDDAPLRVSLGDTTLPLGRVVAGSGAPPAEEVDRLTVPPHGWVVVAPA